MRRFNLGQNTPLTVIWCTGFEHNDANRDSMRIYQGGTENTNTNAHQSSGLGGTRCLKATTSGASIYSNSYGFPALRELVFGGAGYIASSSGSNLPGLYIVLLDSSDSAGFILQWTLDGRVRAARGNLTGTTLSQSADTELTVGEWNWVWARVFVDNSTGNYDAWNGEYSNQVLSETNKDTMQYGDHIYSVSLMVNQCFDSAFDDMFVMGRTMYYSSGSGGSGTPVEGNTLTDGTGSCTIDIVYDDGAGNGVCFVYGVTSAFDGVTTISDGSGWTATPGNALANDEASLSVPEMYMKLAYPNGDVTKNWTSTGGSVHYTEVDDDIGTADYLSTGTAGQLDEFDLQNILPPGSDVKFIQMSAYGRQQGSTSVTGFSLGYNDGTGSEESDEDIRFGTSHNTQDWIWTTNTRTGVAFTTAEAAALTLRLTSKA